MMLTGLLIKVAAVLGASDSLNLTLTFAFCGCRWSEVDFPLVFWFYFAPLLLNIQLVFDRYSRVYGLDRMVGKQLLKTK